MQKIHLEDEKSWPSEVLEFLESNSELFRNWKIRKKHVDPKEYDQVIYSLRSILRNSEYVLHGYHCTRLTEEEIRVIAGNGMSMPSRSMLQQRIEAIRANGLIDQYLAKYLSTRNQADDDIRAGVIWFSFYPPRIAGQRSIERFFLSWGGEALYNSHEDDYLSGPILSKIGKPCIVEAYVPIESLAYHGGVDFNIVARYLSKRGLKPDNPLEYEDRAQQQIPSSNIFRIIRYPEEDFMRLTGAARWKPPLGAS